MLKISDFSRLARVPAKTLRYYDEINLFKPGSVDDWTGYRYYTPDQLPQLNQILALRAVGLSLDQIKQMLDENLSTEQIRGMLRLRQAEIEQALADEQMRLSQIETLLKQLDAEGKMSDYAVVVKALEATKVVGIRGVVPTPADYGATFGGLFGTLGAHLAQKNAQPAGAPMALFLDGEYMESNINVELAFPIAGDIPEAESIKVYDLPAVPIMACVVHQGSFEGVHSAYQHIMHWINDNGYQINGVNREVYLHNDPQNPANNITEIQFPIAK